MGENNGDEPFQTIEPRRMKSTPPGVFPFPKSIA